MGFAVCLPLLLMFALAWALFHIQPTADGFVCRQRSANQRVYQQWL